MIKNFVGTIEVYPHSLRRYVNLDDELRKVYIGQFRKKQRKAGDAAALCGIGGGGGAAGSKTLDRNHFSRIRVSGEKSTQLIPLIRFRGILVESVHHLHGIDLSNIRDLPPHIVSRGRL